MRHIHIPAFAVVTGLACALSAQAMPLYFGDAQRLELKNVAANVYIVPEERDDIDIRVRYGNAKLPTLLVSKRGDTTVLNGQIATSGANRGFGIAIRITDNEGRTSGSVKIPGTGSVNIKDLPIVYVRVPLDAHIQDNGIVFGQIAPSQSLDLTSCASGSWNIAAVSQTLNIIGCGTSDIAVSRAGVGLITSTGSGAISVDRLNTLKANLTGSGGLIVRHVGPVQLQNQGSGDIELGQVGPTFLKLDGSGDVAIGAVTGALTVVNNGSADVNIRQLDGALRLDMAGSGDIDIQRGAVSDVTVRGYGSGDVYFGGQTHTVTVDSYGSGDVKIVRATGAVVTRVRGSADMDIGR
jgi:hypothetical protein